MQQISAVNVRICKMHHVTRPNSCLFFGTSLNYTPLSFSFLFSARKIYLFFDCRLFQRAQHRLWWPIYSTGIAFVSSAYFLKRTTNESLKQLKSTKNGDVFKHRKKYRTSKSHWFSKNNDSDSDSCPFFNGPPCGSRTRSPGHVALSRGRRWAMI